MRCPACAGIGRLYGMGLDGQLHRVDCPECAGGTGVPATADDHLATPRKKKKATGVKRKRSAA